MSLGSIARSVLGEELFPKVGRLYRAVFVDLQKVAESFPVPPPGAAVLDIGGGDGEALKPYLDRHPEVRVTMIDLKPSIGTALTPEQRQRVELLPATSIRDLAATGRHRPDMIILSDVLHHIPAAQREAFFGDIRALLDGRAATLVIKDVEPGRWRATLGYLADRYISGDRNVQQIGQRAMTELVQRVFPRSTCQATALIERDPPNYTLVFTLPGRVSA